ncbi:MAG: PilW family protein [Methylococcaceae bacterium]|jgi:type IV pilus assembly protein PilW
MSAAPLLKRPPLKNGFSLIEIMLALALGLTVMLGIAKLSLQASQNHRSLRQGSQEIENGRYALAMLAEELEHAGFYGDFSPAEAQINLPETLSDLPDPCDLGTQTLTNGLLFPVVAYASSPGKSCESALTGRVNGTGVLVIRRASTEVIDAAMIAGQVYIQSTINRYIIGCLTEKNCASSRNGPPGTGFSLVNAAGDPAEIRSLVLRIFYIRSWSSISSDGIPTLVRTSLSYSSANRPTLRSEPMIEGIEDLQVDLGLDNALSTDCSAPPVVGDGIPDIYVSPTALSCWKDAINVVSTRIDLLARSIESNPVFTDTKTYFLGRRRVGPMGDHYRRHVFARVVRITNISSRRQP